MTSTILECSQKNSYNESSNSESNWKNSFQNEVSLEDGDTLQMKMCLINTQAISSTNIIIKTDTTVAITFGVYEVAFPPTGVAFNDDYFLHENNFYWRMYNRSLDNLVPTATLDNSTATFAASDKMPEGHYILRKGADPASEMVTYTCSVTIPAGSYTADAIAGFINTSMKTFRTTESIGTSVIPEALTGDKRFVSIITPDATPRISKSFNFKEVNVYSNDGTANSNILFTAGRNAGASTTLFEYKDDAFQFSYLHTPIMSEKNVISASTGENSYSTPGVTIKANAEGFSDVFDSLGGVVLTELSPASFWQQIGFTPAQMSDILFDDNIFSALNDDVKEEYITQRTTGVNVSNSLQRSSFNVFNFTNPQPVEDSSAVNAYPEATSDLRSLRASNPYIVDDIGFYRIECVANFESNYLVPNQRLGAVTGIVSKNYNTMDFITGYGGDSALAYTHSGETLALNNINIRIIDPKTEKEAEQLGPNSTVFLELIKAPPKAVKK